MYGTSGYMTSHHHDTITINNSVKFLSSDKTMPDAIGKKLTTVQVVHRGCVVFKQHGMDRIRRCKISLDSACNGRIVTPHNEACSPRRQRIASLVMLEFYTTIDRHRARCWPCRLHGYFSSMPVSSSTKLSGIGTKRQDPAALCHKRSAMV